MRIVHLLRKYNPDEWGGTETALLQLCNGLRQQGVTSLVYCPRILSRPPHEPPCRSRREEAHLSSPGSQSLLTSVPTARGPQADGADAAVPEKHGGFDPLAQSGFSIRRFKACLPIWGIPENRRQQLVAVGGNMISLDLVRALWRDPGVALIHSHTLGRLGGVALTVAKLRKIPIVITIHGGWLDVPERVRKTFDDHAQGGLDWGKPFGALFGSRRIVEAADAVLTCNPKEAELLRNKYPHQRVLVQPHGISVERFRKDHRETAREAFPAIRDRQVLLAVGRIDPQKNQAWLIEQAPRIFQKHPRSILVLAGACTDQVYGEQLKRRIQSLELGQKVVLTGGLPPGDPRLTGLYQEAAAVLLPSHTETFGLVILEAWAASACVISSRTSGASFLIRHGHDGWLFELECPEAFHDAVDRALQTPDWAKDLASVGSRRVVAEYDVSVLAGRVKRLYEELTKTHAPRHSPRR
ncbi:MAG: glycosyltransferase family 4 protein [Verrucomicrobia bacterium]|nr:glycosyltransferase family 4 protein [Verrucomicrobiota bacterium]